ncbi:MAG: aldo/keto reductase [Promethearchaeota archaeon]
MKYRRLGKTGYKVSEVSLGTWQVGGRWGEPFDYKNAEIILNKAIALGINFIDTADVYGEKAGQSEKSIGQVLNSTNEKVYVATKSGRLLNPHIAEGYNEENIRNFIENSKKRLQADRIDLLQLHCPPPEVYNNLEVFELLDTLKEEGKIHHYGVSVEKVEEALKAMEFSNVATVQIIFNIFRLKPAEKVFKEAKKRNVGIIARVPLASGLLTGKFTKHTVFNKNDHRFFNRDGQAFDKGETFSGVDYNMGLTAVENLKDLFPDPENLALYALRWILMFDEVSCVIPGASKVSHVEMNVKAANLAPLTERQMNGVEQIYNEYIRPLVHHCW